LLKYTTQTAGLAIPSKTTLHSNIIIPPLATIHTFIPYYKSDTKHVITYGTQVYANLPQINYFSLAVTKRFNRNITEPHMTIHMPRILHYGQGTIHRCNFSYSNRSYNKALLQQHDKNKFNVQQKNYKETEYLR
jgi:hypothetical protein